MKILYSLTLLILSLNSVAQNLSLKEICNLRVKSMVDAEEYLNIKKWDFIRANELSMSFAYRKQNYSNQGESFIHLYPGKSPWIEIQLHDKNKYLEYLSDIKKNNCRLTQSEMKKGMLIKRYKGRINTFIFFIKNASTYTLAVIPNKDANNL